MNDEAVTQIRGLGVSPGIAVGSILFMESAELEVPRRRVHSEAVEDEVKRFTEALTQAEAELGTHRDQALDLSEKERRIFDAQLEFYRDAVFREAIEWRIRTDRVNAEAAVKDQVEHLVAALSPAGGIYAERNADIFDLGNRLQRVLLSRGQSVIEKGAGPFILYAKELLPSDTMSLERGRLLAIVTEVGGETSHMAILARAFGVPAVTGIRGLRNSVAPGATVAVDGSLGIFYPSIDLKLQKTLEQRRARFLAEREKLVKQASSVSRAEEEAGVAVLLNIENFDGLDLDLLRSTQGIGLYRTEFLFMGRSNFPSEEEQLRFYRGVLDQVGPREVTFRTIDVGGDKPLEYLNTPKETNPALGWCGIRLTFKWPDLLIPQLRALLRASVHGNLQILLPMVTHIEEWFEARTLLEQLKDDLKRDGHSFAADVPLGVMIEVPSAAIAAADLAQEADFLSIGTNDLGQYLFAVDRNNVQVADLYRPIHPVMLRVLRNILDAGQAHGKPVTVCGEMAGEPMSALALLGLGLRRFSMSPAHVPEARWIFENYSLAEARALVSPLLAVRTEAEVEESLRRAIEDRSGPSGRVCLLPTR